MAKQYPPGSAFSGRVFVFGLSVLVIEGIIVQLTEVQELRRYHINANTTLHSVGRLIPAILVSLLMAVSDGRK